MFGCGVIPFIEITKILSLVQVQTNRYYLMNMTSRQAIFRPTTASVNDLIFAASKGDIQ